MQWHPTINFGRRQADLKIKGEQVTRPWDTHNLMLIWDADEWVNPYNPAETGGLVRDALSDHFTLYEHRMRVYRMAHGLRSVLGPLAGQTMRHHTRSSTTNRPIEGSGVLFLNAGRQGMSLPTHENRRSESGVSHELCGGGDAGTPQGHIDGGGPAERRL